MNYRIVIATLQLCQTKFKTFEPLIKLIMRIFTSMDNLAKHFLVRIKKVKTAMDSAKFDSLVKHVAKELTPKVYDLITFINDVSDAWQFQIKIIIIVFLLTCSWHQKNETTNSPIHEFKVLQNVFESLSNEKARLKMFFKVINKK